MTVSYDLFLPEVLPYVPDCPQIAAVNAIRNACIEFCNRTLYWQEDLDPLPIVANVSNYPIDTPRGTVFIDLIEAWNDGMALRAASVEELSRKFRGVDWRTFQGQPLYVTRIISSELLLVPQPSATVQNALTMRVAVAPDRDSTTVSEDIYQNYLETIAKGARARLHSTPGQPFFDMGLSQLMAQRFRAECTDARIEVSRGLSRSSVMIQFPGFY